VFHKVHSSFVMPLWGFGLFLCILVRTRVTPLELDEGANPVSRWIEQVLGLEPM
jgi:hypothetical protein